jgi:DNA mismatch repair protein MutL
MAQIHQLSQSLINKIAAGEVIERPASAVKELIENAVDAGATRIHVSAAEGGMEMIRVVDNGCGIAADELELALAPHATSKLRDADDLFRVGTLGFRGEALASIAEVSRVTLRSRTAECPGGAQIEARGGELSDITPCGCPIGATVEVRNLFYNMPVRRKAMSTAATEFSHVKEAFTRIALAMPQIDFALSHNDRPVFELSGTTTWLERIAKFFGRDLAENLIWVESDDGDVQLSGFVAHPSHSRANNRMQYLFLNGRHIRDRALQHALGEAYRGLLLTQRYPIAFLNLAMPPDQVDVNVHPTKIEVRFRNGGRHYSQVLSTLRTKFLSTDLRARGRPEEEDPTGAHDDAHAERLREELVGWAKGKMAAWPQVAAARQPTFDVDEPAPPRTPLELAQLGRRWAPADGGPEDGPDFPDIESAGESAEAFGPSASSSAGRGLGPARAVQVHNRYLVTESEDGLVIVDQHALHERILYEHLRERIASGDVESQSLLVPEPVDLAPAEAAAALENRETLARLGMKIEPFGGDTVLVAGYPAMLANLDPGEVLRALVDRLLEGGKPPSREDLLDELLHTISCKAAIKAGDRLAPDEITALLEQRHLIRDSHHCPHGRPTALVFTREELDRQFKR